MSSASSASAGQKSEMLCRLKRVELAIIGVLWDAGEPRTVREVFEELYSRAPWSFNTVRTTMVQMRREGVLRTQRRGRSNMFVPTIGREEVAAACVEEVVTGITGGKLVDGVVAVLERLPLSAAERRGLRKTM